MANDINEEIARAAVAAFCNPENVESVLTDLEKVAHSNIKPHQQKLGLTDEAMSAFSFERIESAVLRANAAKLQEEGKKLILPADIPLVETALKLGLE